MSDPATVLDVAISRREVLADGITGLDLVAVGSAPPRACDAGAHVDVYVSTGLSGNATTRQRTRYRLERGAACLTDR